MTSDEVLVPGCVRPAEFDPLRPRVYAPGGVAEVVLTVSVERPSVGCGLKDGLAPGG